MTRALVVQAFSATCMAACLFAQSATWIVDVHNGPGTNFTSLQTAIISAAAGDRLLVRGGNYQPALVDRPLSIVGDGNVVIVGSGGYSPGFLVLPIPEATTLAITGITFAATALTHESLRINAGAGTVILDRVHSTLLTTLSYSEDVRITRSQFDQGFQPFQSSAAMDRCVVGPLERTFSNSGRASLIATSSHLVLNRCQVRGADAYAVNGFLFPATAAIDLSASTMVLCDDGSGSIAAGTGGSTPAVLGSGVLEIDPHAVLVPTGSAPAVSGVVAVTRIRPSLSVDAGSPGGIVEVDLFGPAGDGYLEAIGLATAPWIDPVLQDRLWLQPTLLWDIGTFGASSRAHQQIPLPNSQVLIGVSFTWQAVSFGATSGLALSNPVSYVHPN
jgi:hypothetical protein